MKMWCEHLVWHDKRYYQTGTFNNSWWYEGSPIPCNDSWNLCPSCGAKRPSESVGLAEKIHKTYPNISDYNIIYETIAEMTKSHYFSKESEKALADIIHSETRMPFTRNQCDQLAKRVCEWFRGLK